MAPVEHLKGQQMLLQLGRVLLKQLWALWAYTHRIWVRPDSVPFIVPTASPDAQLLQFWDLSLVD